MLSIPILLLGLGIGAACAVRGCLGGAIQPGIGVIIFLIALVNWTYIFRIVRGLVLSLREREFVEAARALGASNARIMFREILPNLVAPMIVYATLLIPLNILLEASLSFLGVGVRPPTASWGQMIAAATPIFNTAWWYMIFPGARAAVDGARLQPARRRAARRAQPENGPVSAGARQRQQRRRPDEVAQNDCGWRRSPAALMLALAACGSSSSSQRERQRGRQLGPGGRADAGDGVAHRRQEGRSPERGPERGLRTPRPGQSYFPLDYEITNATQRSLYSLQAEHVLGGDARTWPKAQPTDLATATS